MGWLLAFSQQSPLAATTVDQDISAWVDKAVDYELNQSIVVGIIDRQGKAFHSAGNYSPDDQRQVTAGTLFDMGSAAQIFTASITATLLAEKQLSLQSTLNPLLPQEIEAPAWEGESLRVFDLLTHSAALPELPPNLDPEKNPKNPYAEFKEQDLYRALSNTRLPFKPGYKYYYSKYGYALLGRLLERRTAQDYATLLQAKLALPLNLKNTTAQPTEEQLKNLAHGHVGFEATSRWDYAAMAGDGGVYSSAEDLLQFLGAHLGVVKTDLSDAFKPLQKPYLKTHIDDTSIGLGWHVTQNGQHQLHWFSSQANGYSVFIGMNVKVQRGVVVLSNSARRIDELGFHALAPDAYPLQNLIEQYPLDPGLLANYTGSYQVSPEIVLEVSREGNRLYAQLTSEPKFRIFPQSETRFRYAQGKREINFKLNAKGKANSIAITENFKTLSAKRR